MRQQIKDRFLGVIVTGATGIAAFLLLNYIGSFVTMAHYNEDMSRIDANQKRIIQDLRIIKEHLLEKKN